MPILFDLYGVVLLSSGFNQPLVAAAQAYRQPANGLYIASNVNAQAMAEVMWQLPQLRQLFDGVLTSDDFGVAKPSPGFYQAVMRELQCQPAQCLFFDDSATNVAAALAQGWQAFVYHDVATCERLMQNHAPL